MKIRRILFDTLIILIFLVLFMIWHNNRYETISVTTVSKPNIYLITMEKKSPFWSSLNQGVKDMATLLGVTYQWNAPAERDVDEQIKIFNQAVEAGADAILLAASDPERISASVKAAKEKGVKIIYVYAPAIEEAITTLATENYSAGQTAGENMISELGAAGITSGSIGIIGVTPENITTRNRELGFRDTITEDGRYRILDTIYTENDINQSKIEAEKLIQNNKDLVGLYGTNEESTIGVGKAIQATNPKIVGIGFDYTIEIYNLLRNQYLDVVLLQNPYTMGYLGMAQAYAAINGYNTGPSFINTGVSVITKYQPRRPLAE